MNERATGLLTYHPEVVQMSEFISNIKFGKSPAQQELELLNYMWRLTPLHCCECGPDECGAHNREYTCPSCEDWLTS